MCQPDISFPGMVGHVYLHFITVRWQEMLVIQDRLNPKNSLCLIRVLMTEGEEKKALIVLGCPEVPVQNSLAVFTAYQLKKNGYSVLIAGNPAVMKLLMTSDPEKYYISSITTLEKAVEDITENGELFDLCLAFAHSDAGISYAATMRYLLPGARFVTIVFGRDAEKIGGLIEYDGEAIVEVAVHNPMPIRKKMSELLGWAATKN